MTTKVRKNRWLAGGMALLLLAASVGAVKLTAKSMASAGEAMVTPVVYTPKAAAPVSQAEAERALASAKDLSTAFRVAADRALPAVVTIETTVGGGQAVEKQADADSDSPFGGRNPFEGTPFEDMFRNGPWGREFRFNVPRSNRPQHGLGSGVIIDSTGLILTNNHVVAGGKDVKVLVRLSDGREFTADSVWTDSKTDIAVVKIDGAKDLVPAQLADSDQVSVGDWVLALGQPFGLESTVTAGIISATHRGVGINARESYLQTDAAINPGNSGGPLVNLDGQVVGINTAISSHGGGNEGIGFAVPINLAKWVADQLANGGTVRRAYLGIGIQPVDAQMAEQFGVKPRQGVLVTEVYPDTPAAKAGLKVGDVIVEYAGVSVSSPQDLQVTVERSKLGQPHELKVIRDRQPTTLRFVPEEQPADFGERRDVGGEVEATPGSTRLSKLGLEISDLTPDVGRQLGVDAQHGVVITEVRTDSVAERAGLEAGMVIVEINRHAVGDVKECVALLANYDGTSPLLLRVNSSQGSRFVVLKP